MDKTINDKDAIVVEFKYFLFEPNLKKGPHEATFTMVAYHIEKDKYIMTSDIIDIHNINDDVYIETINSVYKLADPYAPCYLKYIKRYFEDTEYSSGEVFDLCVANEMVTEHGWKIY